MSDQRVADLVLERASGADVVFRHRSFTLYILETFFAVQSFSRRLFHLIDHEN